MATSFASTIPITGHSLTSVEWTTAPTSVRRSSFHTVTLPVHLVDEAGYLWIFQRFLTDRDAAIYLREWPLSNSLPVEQIVSRADAQQGRIQRW